MDENYTNLAVHIHEVDSRSRFNEHRLDDHEAELRELREQQDGITEKLLWLITSGIAVGLLSNPICKGRER